MKIFLFSAFAFIATLAVSAVSAHLVKINRDDLNIQGNIEERCAAPRLLSLWRLIDGYPDYSLEQVMNYFGLFAAYASNAYLPGPKETFAMKPEEFGWTQRNDVIARAGGFQAQVFHMATSDRLYVMTVYRGTDGLSSIEDNISNASWFTQMINPWDQYRTARDTYQEIRADAKDEAAGKTISYLTVGHSLGGGLARHVAKAFPCTAAIAFNSSFVTNEFRLDEPYSQAQVVDLFEEDDPLSWVTLYTKPDQFFKNNVSHQWYRLYNVGSMESQHGIYSAARAMARIPAVCLTPAGGCGNAIHDTSWLPAAYEFAYPVGSRAIQKLWCKATPMKVESQVCNRESTAETTLAQ
ncbi:hypothetical protein [Sinorhizobium meliloti]|uniref:hypothetical protein n=1 Tax=Rhizobium meliloti TaxID=382 RepID=UPI003F157744